MKKSLLVGVIALAIAGAGQAFADSHGSCPLTYETFEFAVPHSDLEKCPAGMGVEKAFCRVSVVAEVATVFAFDEQTNCILTTKSFDEDAFKIEFKE